MKSETIIKKKDMLETLFRTRMPYQVFVSTTTDDWWGTGRDYKPLDATIKFNHRYGRFPTSRNYRYFSEGYDLEQDDAIFSYPDYIEREAFKPNEYVRLWLYDDGCPPWQSQKDLNQYLEIYNNIHSLEDRNNWLVSGKKVIGVTE